MANLTKRTVDAIRPDGRDALYWDDALPGFGLRVKPSGVKTWVVQYRNMHGRTRRLALGQVSRVTPEQARKRARIELGKVEAGADPSGERKLARQAATVSEICEDYLTAGRGRIKASTLAMDASRIARHVKPLLGARAVKSLTPADIERFMRDVANGKTAKAKPAKGARARGGQTTGGAGVAARTVGMLGTILERAVRDGTIDRNPVRLVKRPKDIPSKPPFSFEALSEVGEAMRAAEMEGENPTGLRALRLLMLTGCRRMEILSLRWDAVDSRASCLRLADTKTGAQVRPVGRVALSMIEAAPRAAKAVYVLPAKGGKGHFIGLPRVWARVAKRAKVKDVSIHGLRHWFASAAAEMNFSELTIAGLLGHRVKGVTARYATTPDTALVAAADRVSRRIAAALGIATDEASVIPLHSQASAAS